MPEGAMRTRSRASAVLCIEPLHTVAPRPPAEVIPAPGRPSWGSSLPASDRKALQQDTDLQMPSIQEA